MIHAPYTIAKLPEGPFPGESRIQSADVYSVSGSKRRKRSELAVAIDQSCVNLYDVNTHSCCPLDQSCNGKSGTLIEACYFIPCLSPNRLLLSTMLRQATERWLDKFSAIDILLHKRR